MPTPTPCAVTPQAALLAAAAECFMERGYQATSIDDIARRLGATKGKVYHYFDSKADIFFAIHAHAMDALFEVIAPLRQAPVSAGERLYQMACAHVRTLIRTQPFQRAVAEGVHMHLRNTASEAEQDQIAALQRRRDAYEAQFLAVLEEGIEEGELYSDQPGLALKPMFGALNATINWYRARPDQPDAALDLLADRVAGMALAGLWIPTALRPSGLARQKRVEASAGVGAEHTFRKQA